MKLLLVIDNLNMGGIATSFYNFINEISNYPIHCDVLVFDKDSINYIKIPHNVNVLPVNELLSLLGKEQKQFLSMRKMYLKRAVHVLIAKIFSGNFSRKLLFNKVDCLGEYDLAIAYSHDLGWHSFTPGCRQFVFEKVKAKKKAVYVHCDYSLFGGKDFRQFKDYNKFDYILCVSNGCKNSFLNIFPTLEDKTIVLENFTDCEDIHNKCHELEIYPKNRITFVSACRLSEEKGIQRTIKVFDRIKTEGHKNFKWIIIGDGPLKENIKNDIIEKNLQDYVELIGKKDNPYRYIKNADAFLLLSYHEAAPMVFGECITLKVPIISTETISAKELVEVRNAGIVCDNTEYGIYTTLKYILTNSNSLKRFKSNDFNVNIHARKQLKVLLNLTLNKIKLKKQIF